uniref:Helicase superfamily 3 single-stranded DNA/RNA virus domain-containing protein n=1 Tax=Cardamom bushy dwarf virus TaxID=262588 RepID=A0A0H5BIX4_9VIRU|nr:hypothetical protein [Cardamom bushy dwarf virus]
MAKGSDEDNARYCSKETLILQLGMVARSPERMRIEQPEIFHRYESVKKATIFKDEYQHPSLDRQWQIQLTEAIAEEADDRTIIWVYGPNGNEGKSTYAKSLMKKDWFYTRGGKKENILFSYVDEGSDEACCVRYSPMSSRIPKL